MSIKHCKKCHSQLDINGRHYHVTDCVNKQLDKLDMIERKFTSSNNIDVERITLRRKEWYT